MQFNINGDSIYASNGGVEHRQGQPAILFIHGAGMDQTIWVLLNRFFARKGFNTFALDLPGHGKSGGKALASVEEIAQWLEKFMQEANIQGATLIGHSLGSLVVIETAARLADKISQIILLGTSCPMPVGEPLLSAAEKNQHAAVDMIMLFGHAYCSQLGGNPVAGLHIINNSMRLLERALDGTLFTDLNACNQYTNGLAAAAKIQAPATLILGEQDRMTPPAAALPLLEALANTQVEYLKNCGHMMISEQPEQVHQALLKALARK